MSHETRFNFIIAGLILAAIFVFYITSNYSKVSAMRDYAKQRPTAINGSVILNAMTFTQIVPKNINRVCIAICTLHPALDAFLNFRSVEDSIDETGIILNSDRRCIIMSDIVYTGPISAIAAANDPKLIYIEF